MQITNLINNLPNPAKEEIIEVIHQTNSIRIERIISFGHISPKDFWYDQEEDESVTILQGAARLMFEGDSEPIPLIAGDMLQIPAHKKHRVEWTIPDQPTVWLAIFSKQAESKN